MSDQTTLDVIPAARAFEDGPWAIKHMAGVDKAAAFKAAKRKKMTIGDWLGEAIRSYIEAEHEPMDGAVYVPQGGQNLTLGEPIQALSIVEIEQAVRLAEHIATLRGQPIRPRSTFLRAAQRLLMQRIEGSLR